MSDVRMEIGEPVHGWVTVTIRVRDPAARHTLAVQPVTRGVGGLQRPLPFGLRQQRLGGRDGKRREGAREERGRSGSCQDVHVGMSSCGYAPQ